MPLSVETAPLPSATRLILLVPQQATYSQPRPSAMPTEAGLWYCATAAAPSAHPPMPLPLSVLTAPPGLTTRMRALEVSEMKAKPELLTARPVGELKRAAVGPQAAAAQSA